MRYDLTSPCGDCPFRVSTNFSFPEKRTEEILYADGGFSCHKTTTKFGRSNSHKNAQACAGRLILMEREEQPDQMMRIYERLGLYDRTKLDINNSDVFDSFKSFRSARTQNRRS